MPQNHFIVATRGPSPELYIWDLSKHPSFPTDKSTFCPQGVCLGHEKEGYAMIWSKHQQGHLLSGAEDATVRLWDINAAATPKAEPGTQVKPVATFRGCEAYGHTDTVEDVDWHCKDPNMVVSVGDDKRICLWDIRDPTKTIKTVKDAHDNDINCVAFNPVNEYVFATGSAGKSVTKTNKTKTMVLVSTRDTGMHALTCFLLF
jgi:histone-binding protein RBBP4